jgi:hypothetical protein
MNGNYQLNRFYAQEKVDARLREAEYHRLSRRARPENSFGFVIAAANRAANWFGRATDQAVQSLEKLGQTRAAPLHR